MTVLAMTGGSGFVGGAVIRRAAAQGLHIRALTRRPQPDVPHVTWVAGALDDAAALHVLCEGADAVLHIAGVVNAPDRAGFDAGNVAGTAAVLAAAQASGVRRFVHVSSLAARLPDLSEYGGSKARAEDVVRQSGLDTTIIRPPAVYGPGDSEMRDLFKMARRGWVFLPPKGRISVIHVDDLADLLLALVPQSGGDLLEADDGTPHGWSHGAFAKALGAAFDRDVHTLSVPKPLMLAGAMLDKLWRGDKAKLTRDRVNYICHDDWVIDPARRPPPEIWQPQVATDTGLRTTAAWYQAAGWLD